MNEIEARQQLGAALKSWSLTVDVDGAALVSQSDTFVFELPVWDAVGKVARDPGGEAGARRAVQVAEWLAVQEVPAVRAAAVLSAVPLAERVVAQPYAVTLWQRIPAAVRAARPADLAPLLRRLHTLEAPEFALPTRDLLGSVGRWLAGAEGHVDASDVRFLLDRREAVLAAIGDLAPALPPGPIHGDALPRNVRVTADGPVLLDLDTFASDLREHDLTVLALSRERYGLSESEYRAFTDAYGWDVRDWPGCRPLRAAREIASAAWVARHAATNPAAAREFQHRVESLRGNVPDARWHAF